MVFTFRAEGKLEKELIKRKNDDAANVSALIRKALATFLNIKED